MKRKLFCELGPVAYQISEIKETALRRMRDLFHGVASGIGGGMCQLANLIHYMVLHSPLEVTELHHHTDALFPDSGRRVPFGTGTSVSYKKLDYRFYNGTDTPVQLRVWQDETTLYGELRGTQPLPVRYRLEEEDNHFAKDADGCYYRNSRVYRVSEDVQTGEELARELVLANHSKVMYDYDLIPKDQIRQPV